MGPKSLGINGSLLVHRGRRRHEFRSRPSSPILFNTRQVFGMSLVVARVGDHAGYLPQNHNQAPCPFQLGQGRKSSA